MKKRFWVFLKLLFYTCQSKHKGPEDPGGVQLPPSWVFRVEVQDGSSFKVQGTRSSVQG